MSRILVIRNDELDPHVSVADCMGPVEKSFVAITEGRAELPAKYHDRTPFGMWFFMGGHSAEDHAMAVKLGCAPAAGVSCQVIHYDAVTAAPLALMEGLRVTYLRTGAAAAIGARHLARPDSRVVAVLGAGRVGWYSLIALKECFDLQKVLVADAAPEAARSFAQRGAGVYDFPVEPASLEAATRAADIVITGTPAREPFVRDAWVRPGTHISAMGADTRGKQELDAAIHLRARVVCDYVAQCLKWGDINNTVADGGLQEGDLVGEIGEVILGRKPGRTADDEVTLFDATGMGIQDAVVAKLIYDTAERVGFGTAVEL
ncbi:MAG: ornithine cyclodeaminase family protein [Gemmatimonadota bacterium]